MLKVCIDAGHGGQDSGAVAKGYFEKDITLNLALKVGALINDKVDVVYTRNNDTHISLLDRCKVSNKADCDYFVSIHVNSATNKEASGIETFIYTNTGSKATNLANNIQNALIKSTGAKNRGVKTSETLYVLKHTIAPAVLVECGFISNHEESELLFDDDYQNKIANAIVTGIENTLTNKDNLNG